MANPVPDPFAQSILLKEKRKAHARAVLRRPLSAVPAMLVAAAISGFGLVFLNAQQFEAPLAVKGVLIAVVVVCILNAMDLWTTRRRLEAAITLLELQQESHS